MRWGYNLYTTTQFFDTGVPANMPNWPKPHQCQTLSPELKCKSKDSQIKTFENAGNVHHGRYISEFLERRGAGGSCRCWESINPRGFHYRVHLPCSRSLRPWQRYHLGWSRFLTVNKLALTWPRATAPSLFRTFGGLPIPITLTWLNQIFIPIIGQHPDTFADSIVLALRTFIRSSS
jgi:hypothetical protein